jgi:hypothetical protein
MNQHAVKLTLQPDVPSEIIHSNLQQRLIKQIGGLEQFYGRPIVLKLIYIQKKEPAHPLDDSVEHMLWAEISEVAIDETFRVALPQEVKQSKHYSRWDRLKQFIKGE